MPARLSRAVDDRDHAEGRSDAPVTLVEYGDFQCPHCGRAFHVVKAVQRHFGAGLRFVFRHFPLVEMHPQAELAAEAAEAAGAQGQFWPMHDWLFENQGAIGLVSLRMHAGSLPLNVARWERELAGREYAEHVRQDLASGIESGVRGTPTFYINDLRHDGPADERSLMSAIEETLRSHRHAPPR